MGIFTNFRLGLDYRDTSDGKIYGAVLGEWRARDRRVYLTAQRKAGQFINGNSPKLAIGSTSSSDPTLKIRKQKCAIPTQYLILSSRAPKTPCARRSTGEILMPAGQQSRLLDYATGNLRNGLQSYLIVVVEACPGDIFYVEIRQSPSYVSRRFFLVDRDRVSESTPARVNEEYHALLTRLGQNRDYIAPDLFGYDPSVQNHQIWKEFPQLSGEIYLKP